MVVSMIRWNYFVLGFSFILGALSLWIGVSSLMDGEFHITIISTGCVVFFGILGYIQIKT